MVAPTGGPKDTEAPKVTKCLPANFSANYKNERIKIYFDEFAIFNDANNSVIISPPFKNDPDFITRGKMLLVTLNEKLKENTTYTINFGNAIADITEKNPLTNFQYVFSTGSTVDSLSIKGKVLNAFTGQPEKDIFVMLYLNQEDSVPLTQRPYYLSKTNDNGEFELSNLKDHPYKLFALKDFNSNYIYDLPNESIGYSDTLISPRYIFRSINDSTKIDSIKNLIVYLFEEKDTTQKILKSSLIEKKELFLVFKQPTKNLRITPLNLSSEENWCIEEINPTKDTAIFWLTKTQTELLAFQVKDDGIIIDTIDFPFSESKNIKKSAKQTPQKLSVLASVSSVADINKPISITFSHPVKKYDLTKIKLIEEKDTLVPQIEVLSLRKMNINHKWKEKTNYKLFILDSTFTDIYQLSHDTIITSFKTKSIEDYGTLSIHVKLKNTETCILQFLTEKEIVIDEKFIGESSSIKYDYLTPGNYKVKLIIDRNRNNKWDTGKYIDKKQPEKTIYYPSIINVRKNWDVEIELEN